MGRICIHFVTLQPYPLHVSSCRTDEFKHMKQWICSSFRLLKGMSFLWTTQECCRPEDCTTLKYHFVVVWTGYYGYTFLNTSLITSFEILGGKKEAKYFHKDSTWCLVTLKILKETLVTGFDIRIVKSFHQHLETILLVNWIKTQETGRCSE